MRRRVTRTSSVVEQLNPGSAGRKEVMNAAQIKFGLQSLERLDPRILEAFDVEMQFAVHERL
jgi:hypothetical protein